MSFDQPEPTAVNFTEMSWLSSAAGMEARFEPVPGWFDVRIKLQFRAEAVIRVEPMFELGPTRPKVGVAPYDVVGHNMQTGPDFQLDLTFARRVRVSASGSYAILGNPGSLLQVSASYDPLPGIRLQAGTEFIAGAPDTRFARTAHTGRFFLRARYEFGR